MPRPNVVTAASQTAVPIATTAETKALEIDGLATSGPGAAITLTGHVVVTLSAATTAVVIQLRRGSGVGGTSIYSATINLVTAGDTVDFAFGAIDAIGEVAGQVYSLTVTCTGANSSSSVVASELTAICP